MGRRQKGMKFVAGGHQLRLEVWCVSNKKIRLFGPRSICVCYKLRENSFKKLSCSIFLGTPQRIGVNNYACAKLFGSKK